MRRRGLAPQPEEQGDDVPRDRREGDEEDDEKRGQRPKGGLRPLKGGLRVSESLLQPGEGVVVRDGSGNRRSIAGRVRRRGRDRVVALHERELEGEGAVRRDGNEEAVHGEAAPGAVVPETVIVDAEVDVPSAGLPIAIGGGVGSTVIETPIVIAFPSRSVAVTSKTWTP